MLRVKKNHSIVILRPVTAIFLMMRTKRDISAVALIVLSIALFAMVFMGSEGVVTGAISLGLRFCFGIGAYVLPFLLIGLAATLLIRFEREMVPARVAIGFGLLFLAFLTIVSLFTPGADVDPNCLFIQVLLVDHGGYVGGSHRLAVSSCSV